LHGALHCHIVPVVTTAAGAQWHLARRAGYDGSHLSPADPQTLPTRPPLILLAACAVPMLAAAQAASAPAADDASSDTSPASMEAPERAAAPAGEPDVVLSDEGTATQASNPSASASTPPASAAPRPAPAPGHKPPFEWPPRERFEGAIGPVVTLGRGPGDTGASTSITPGFFLRYKGVSISNTGAFVTRGRHDDIFRGFGADLRYSDTIRTNFGLRLDRGRSSSAPGLDSVGATVRGRVSTTWTPPRDDRLYGWRFTGTLTADLLNRGGGQTFDVSASRDWYFGPYLIWSLGGDLGAASGQYMRQQYGVRPDEAQRSGFPAYMPGAGLRDVSVGTTWRLEFDPRWVAFWGGSIGRLLGPAAASPLTVCPSHWELQGGVARRF
jgi:outer membrane scaffolding protein for murein synthesis (MipA/OmpV family)